MAHLIKLPTSFEFRTTKVQWEEACAHVIGWRKDQGESDKIRYLIAEISSASGGKSTIGLPLKSLPEKHRERSLKTLKLKNGDEAVKDICSDLELRYFVHGCKTYVEDSALRKHSHVADAWQLREDFLGLKGDGEITLAFLNKWGRWVPHRNYVDLAEI